MVGLKPAACPSCLMAGDWKGDAVVRAIQIIIFLVGLVAFLASGAVAGSMLGDIFWRAGVGAMLVDVVCIQLWPRRREV